MRVKRLDLLGFKSFANKTTVHFEPGVTAIVGPNGSGKSNLVDGIRWVLGEHNPRDVRAPRLEDVIFNGTDTKAPLSMAEVSFLIENDRGLLPIAFTEILIARRVYRSGESEYFINQSPCRLKDIHELFLGTGLGGGTYAIIEQGHIDMILSSKPEERRGVFEEASGVAKYLSKRQETIRRLDEVEQHLTRIVDITSEVRRQLGALERQASKARRYKTQWEQLKQWEIRLAADELRTGSGAEEALKQQVAALSDQRSTLEAKKQQLLSSLDACNAAVSATQAGLQELRAKVMESAGQIEQHGGQVALKTRWSEELAQQRQQLLEDTAKIEARATLLAQQHAQATEQHEQLSRQHQEAQAQRGRAAEELTTVGQAIAAVLGAAEELKAQLFEAASEASRRRNALAGAAMRLQALEAQAARVNEQRGQARRRLEAVAGRQQQLDQERARLREQVEALQEQLVSAREVLGRAQAERHELMGRLSQLREHVVSQRAKAQLLEESWHRYEGFPDAVKTLLAAPPEGVVGLLADLFDAESGYEQALETALGPLTSAIIVRDRAALRRCQEALASQGLEGAQFIALSDAVAHEPSRPSAGDGVVGSLSQFVRHDPAYAGLAAWLLGPWGVLDEIGRVLSGTMTLEGRWVTASGDRWDGWSWQLAGRRSSQSVRVGRRQRWERAHEELALLQREEADAQAAWQQAETRWQSLVADEERIRRQSEELTPNLTKLDGQLTQLLHEAQRVQEELAAQDLDGEELLGQQRDLTSSQAGLHQSVAEAEARQAALETSLKDAQRRQEDAGQRRQQLHVSLAQLDTTLQSMTERLAALQGRLADVCAEQEQMTAQLSAKRSQAQGMAQKADELAAQLEEHRRAIITATEQRARLGAEADQAAQRLRQEEQRRDEVLPGVLAAEQELLTLVQMLQAHETRLTERSFRRARVLERLQEVYHIEEATVLAEAAGPATGGTPSPAGIVPARSQSAPLLTDEERASLTEQTLQLKAKLEAMGPVSLGSVEEYDELTKRLEFLQTQQQDLLKAKSDLRDSIHQINRTARQQFRETFAKIRDEFRHYYTKLFGGGEADLILVDEEDVLESGIEIVARPPGKRLQSISLLSGGERALTAIALLFALFKVRPSPFCILDEIDAPLDEANVDRFTKVLEEFLSLSQFILITHNKKTITKADCLYGVTMEQPGISKIVSVKLAKSRQAPPAAAPEAATPEAAEPAAAA